MRGREREWMNSTNRAKTNQQNNKVNKNGATLVCLTLFVCLPVRVRVRASANAYSVEHH